jgi:hypothetical protein
VGLAAVAQAARQVQAQQEHRTQGAAVAVVHLLPMPQVPQAALALLCCDSAQL